LFHQGVTNKKKNKPSREPSGTKENVDREGGGGKKERGNDVVHVVNVYHRGKSSGVGERRPRLGGELGDWGTAVGGVNRFPQFETKGNESP